MQINDKSKDLSNNALPFFFHNVIRLAYMISCLILSESNDHITSKCEEFPCKVKENIN